MVDRTRVLGIDPGTASTGYGVVERCDNSLFHVHHGVIRTDSRRDLPYRLCQIFNGIQEIIGLYKPDQAAIEDIFYSRNPKTALILGHSRGAAILAAADAGLQIYQYSPLEVKSAVVGYGRASKGQVQRMIQFLLNLPETGIHLDASDALAVGICHLNSMELKVKIEQAEGLAGRPVLEKRG